MKVVPIMRRDSPILVDVEEIVPLTPLQIRGLLEGIKDRVFRFEKKGLEPHPWC